LHGGDFGDLYPSGKTISPERTIAGLTSIPML
jgi:hypothetical protein